MIDGLGSRLRSDHELVFQNWYIGAGTLVGMNANLSISPQKSSSLAHRGLKPADILAEGRPHGTRVRYLGGCRCADCRQANTNYERERQQARATGDWNGIVSADRARAHLLVLAAQGVGRRAVVDVSDIPSIIVSEIRSGKKLRIRARTERRILAITPAMAADHALIDAAPTWKLIAEMLAAGFTKTRIAGELNHSSRHLQLGREKITVRNAAAVELAHRRLMASDEVLVPATQSLQMIERLRDEGYTMPQLLRAFRIDAGELPTKGRASIRRGIEKAIRFAFQNLTE